MLTQYKLQIVQKNRIFSKKNAWDIHICGV